MRKTLSSRTGKLTQGARVTLSPSPTSDAFENAHRLLTYHQNAMQSRRSVELRLFTGVIAFMLLVTKGFLEYKTVLSGANNLRTVIAAGIILCILCYAAVLVLIETASHQNRIRYAFWDRVLERLSKNSVIASPNEYDVDVPVEGLMRAVLSSWAAGPPLIAAFMT